MEEIKERLGKGGQTTVYETLLNKVDVLALTYFIFSGIESTSKRIGCGLKSDITLSRS